MLLSSTWLGRYSFKIEKGVRSSLGVQIIKRSIRGVWSSLPLCLRGDPRFKSVMDCMGFWNNKISSGSDMGTDIMYTFIKAFGLIFLCLIALAAFIVWLIS